MTAAAKTEKKAKAPKAPKAKKPAGAKPVADARSYDVLLAPVVTEKTTMMSEHSKVVFKVRTDARKGEIKKAVEALFGVTVERVNTINGGGKVKAFRGMIGTRQDFKKAVITLAKGQSIDLAAGVA